VVSHLAEAEQIEVMVGKHSSSGGILQRHNFTTPSLTASRPHSLEVDNLVQLIEG
jgi:hypothetical protein